MTNFLKYLSSFVLVLALIGCQNDTDETAEQTPQQPSQQQQPQQQPGQMGQMQQSAPDIDVSDEEAETFVDAAMDAQQVQMKAQKRMIGIIEEEGLDVETYQKIAQSTQMGQSPQGQDQSQDTDISDEEMEKFESASESLQEVQGEIQQEVTTAVEDAGMEMQRFQQISQAAQQDPELRKTIQSKMQEKQGAQMQQQQPPSGN